MSLKEKILIADDSEMNQMLLEEILSDKYEYVMAKDGTEAVDILEKNDDIDLVIRHQHAENGWFRRAGGHESTALDQRGAGYHHIVRK